MKYSIDNKPTYSLASITRAKSDIAVAVLSVDLHTKNTILTQTTEALYTKMLLSGAGPLNREDFITALSLLGSRLSISVRDGVFTITVLSTAQSFKKTLALVEYVLLKPHFSPSELKRVKKVTTNELKQDKENSKAISHRLLKSSFYSNNDRRHVFTEDELIAHVEKVDQKTLKKLHGLLFKNSWTATVGANKEQVAMFEKMLKKCSPTAKNVKPEVRFHEQNFPKAALLLKEIPSKQNVDINIGAPVPITLEHPDYIPLAFGLAVLGKWGGFAGRLMSTVREEEGLTYGIYASPETFYKSERGYWRIMTFFAPNKAIQGLTSTFREIKKIADKGITDAELKQFKQILKTQRNLAQDSTEGLVETLHGYHRLGFSLKEIETFKAKFDNLKLEEVNNTIQKYLDTKTLTISAVGPIVGIKSDLQKFLKSVT